MDRLSKLNISWAALKQHTAHRWLTLAAAIFVGLELNLQDGMLAFWLSLEDCASQYNEKAHGLGTRRQADG